MTARRLTPGRGPMLAVGLALGVLAGCGGDTQPADPGGDEPDAAGSIEISASTAGASRPLDYLVLVDGEQAGRVRASGSLTLAEVNAGDHAVELREIPDNCQLSGPNPRVVSVTPASPSSAAFELSCISTLGTIEVEVTTTGVEPDVDGFAISVQRVGGLAALETIPANGVVTMSFAPDDYQVVLSGIAANCTLEGENPVAVEVVTAATLSIGFEVDCVDGPDNRIAYTRSIATDQYAIWTMDAVGSRPVRVTGDRWNASGPDWSADARWLAFVDRWGVSIVDLQGAEPATYLDGWYWNVGWAPDGDRLVVVGYVTDWVLQLGIFDLSTSDFLEVFSVEAWDAPAWSPDGSRIAFVGAHEDQMDIWVVDADGTNLTRLTTGEWTEGHPTWSPDGSRIAFHSNRTGTDQLYVMNADGSGIVRLTESASNDRAPDWSPDGERVAFETDRHGNWDIYYIGADGSGLARVTDGAADETDPAWSP